MPTPSRRVTRRLIIAGIAVVVAGAAAVLVATRRHGGGAVQYETATITRTYLASKVTASGTLSPLVTVLVGSQVSGRIKELRVDFNSRVSRGQVIAQIDPQLFESEVAKARANRASARASIARAEAARADARKQHERAAALASRHLVAQADADSAEATYLKAEADVTAARAGLAQASASLRQAEVNLAYTTIVAPIDGVVIARNVDVGQTVAASLQAPTLFTIAEDLAKMELHTSVAESDVGRLVAGTPVEFTVDAYPQDRFKGAIRQVRHAPTTVQNVVTYDAVAAVANPELKLRPGMTADVTFVVAERPDALAVPAAALRFRPSADVLAQIGFHVPAAGAGGSRVPRRIAWRLGPGALPDPVTIEIGISDGTMTEVVAGGLAEGDRIITGIAGQKGTAGEVEGQARQRQEAAPRPPGRFL